LSYAYEKNEAAAAIINFSSVYDVMDVHCSCFLPKLGVHETQLLWLDGLCRSFPEYEHHQPSSIYEHGLHGYLNKPCASNDQL
jgi:hypothetical protein